MRRDIPFYAFLLSIYAVFMLFLTMTTTDGFDFGLKNAPHCIWVGAKQCEEELGRK